MSERKIPIDPAVAAALGEPQPKSDTGRKRPRYPSEAKRTKATFDLDAATIEALKGIASAKGIKRGQSKVAEALLMFALDAYESGAVDLEIDMQGPDNWQLVVVEK